MTIKHPRELAGFGLVVGIFLGVIGLILLIVGAVQLGTKRKETISGQSNTFSYTKPNHNSSSPSLSPSNSVEKIYCRHCGKT
jgi:hypothetical protein